MADQHTDASLFTWRDLVTTDLPGSEAFYTQLFGWQVFVADGEWGSYYFLMNGPFAGAMALPDGAPGGSRWLTYVRVADTDGTVALAQQLGGSIARDPFDIPTIGRVAEIIDPAGAAIDVVQLLSADPMPDPEMNPGDIIWTELVTGDASAVRDFYSGLFGWRISPIAEGVDYWIVSVGEKPVRAGILETDPGNSGPLWLPYFRTTAIDQTREGIAAAGGALQSGVIDIPGVGKTNWASDPAGCRFAVMQPAEGFA